MIINRQKGGPNYPHTIGDLNQQMDQWGTVLKGLKISNKDQAFFLLCTNDEKVTNHFHKLMITIIV